MSNSSSPASISSLSPYPSLFLLSELMCLNFLCIIVDLTTSLYWFPCAFILLIIMGKEAYDDYKFDLHDHEANWRYLILASSFSPSPSSEDELPHSLIKGHFPHALHLILFHAC